MERRSRVRERRRTRAGPAGYTVARLPAGARRNLDPMPGPGKSRDPELREELLALAVATTPAEQLLAAERLWEILDDHEVWPGRSLVGDDGAEAAWFVAQHAIDDPGLQRRCLGMLEIAVDCGEADPVHLAYLHDRVRMAEGRDQLYGSQFVLGPSGGLEPWPVDDPAAVDAPRSTILGSNGGASGCWRSPSTAERPIRCTSPTCTTGCGWPKAATSCTARSSCSARVAGSNPGRSTTRPQSKSFWVGLPRLVRARGPDIAICSAGGSKKTRQGDIQAAKAPAAALEE